jgi:hypothetical protein
MTLLGVGKPAGGVGGAPFALDGTPQPQNSVSASSLALPAFSTTFTNDVVCVALISNGGPGLAPTGGGLTFTLRARANDGVATDVTELWCAVASSALASQVITVNTTTSAFVTGVVFAFSGAKSASPFDSNGAIPNSTNSSSTNATFTTNNNGTGGNDILIGMARTGGSVTADPAFTLIYGSNFLGLNYKAVSTAQIASSWTWASGVVGGGSIADAIIQGP